MFESQALPPTTGGTVLEGSGTFKKVAILPNDVTL